MTVPAYPAGTLGALLESPDVTLPTRQALQARWSNLAFVGPSWLDAHSFNTLQAVCGRLIPSAEGEAPLDIAGAIDRALQDGISDGWRFDTLPPDQQAFQMGLQGINETATAFFKTQFAELAPREQDSVLLAVQCGSAPGGAWQQLPPDRFFEELLAAATEAFYSQPLVQESIGYVGMADAQGWQAIGLNELEAREPRPLNSQHDSQNIPND